MCLYWQMTFPWFELNPRSLRNALEMLLLVFPLASFETWGMQERRYFHSIEGRVATSSFRAKSKVLFQLQKHFLLDATSLAKQCSQLNAWTQFFCLATQCRAAGSSQRTHRKQNKKRGHMLFLQRPLLVMS